MADQVIASPETMRNFARSLNESNHQLVDVMNYLSAHLASLGDTWRDDHYRQFEDAFSQAARLVNSFVEQSEAYVQYLHRKSEALDRVREVRLP